MYLAEIDEVYARNLVLGEFKLTSAEVDPKIDVDKIAKMAVPDELFEEVMQYAKENALCEEGHEEI